MAQARENYDGSVLQPETSEKSPNTQTYSLISFKLDRYFIVKIATIGHLSDSIPGIYEPCWKNILSLSNVQQIYTAKQKT